MTGRLRLDPVCSDPLAPAVLPPGVDSLEALSVESLRRVGVDLEAVMSFWDAGFTSGTGVVRFSVWVAESCTEALLERSSERGLLSGGLLLAGKAMGLRRPLLGSLCSSGASSASVPCACFSGSSG